MTWLGLGCEREEEEEEEGGTKNQNHASPFPTLQHNGGGSGFREETTANIELFLHSLKNHKNSERKWEFAANICAIFGDFRSRIGGERREGGREGGMVTQTNKEAFVVDGGGGWLWLLSREGSRKEGKKSTA